MSPPRACVIGWPVTHSRSPVIHGYWLRSLGIAGEYVRQAVEPQQLPAFLRGMQEAGFVGANVTVPHKEAAFAALDRALPIAKELGSANTLWFEGTRLVGTSTDAEGFLANLDQEASGWADRPGPAVVLGAGGAARAIVWALRERGFGPIVVANRTIARAGELADRFGASVKPIGWDGIGAALSGATVLVNTTSLGMVGQPPLTIDLAPLPSTALVTDIVYAPLETPLLRSARARGLAAVDGLGMLLHQAVPGFERWFGQRPSVTPELRAAVIADLAAG